MRKKRITQNLRNLQDHITRSNIHAIGVPDKEERDKGGKRDLKLNSKKAPKFDERHDFTVSRNSRSPRLDKCKEELDQVNSGQPAEIP